MIQLSRQARVWIRTGLSLHLHVRARVHIDSNQFLQAAGSSLVYTVGLAFWQDAVATQRTTLSIEMDKQDIETPK